MFIDKAKEVLLGKYLGFASVMHKEEARKILGVVASSTAEQINRNYRDLLLRNHPDKGGSDYLTQKINEAKEMLIKK
ncbi:DnaJ-like protein subfamily C member 19 [Nematocida sp. LUAm3]|nr:DnaJ-like protein subfamily C member 19 [Nematocida sp. LUAm3]KAI5175612.1 DnaJ-like protein subfamily C member 19 [Nematocida sp. LUAm2]KAI5178518.1 DnaJ-like protein subfamily C member 19 [Nematocida sp. LUAm1]